MRDMGVPYFDREGFLKRLFSEEYLVDCSQILGRQDNKWKLAFYIFYFKPVTDNAVKTQIIKGFKSIRSIRDPNGEMHFPDEVSCVTAV